MWYDLLILGILAYFTVRGAMKGVVWQLAGIGGIILCFFFADAASLTIGPYINLEPPLNHWAALFVSYLGFSFVAFGLARVLNDWIEKAKFGEFNHHLGAIFGFIKGGLLSLILTYLVVTVSPAAGDALRQSYSGRYAAIIMDQLHPIMPEKLHDALANYIHKLDDPSLNLQHSHTDDDILPDSGNDPFGTNLGLPTANQRGSQLDPSLGTPQNSSGIPPANAQSGSPGNFWNQLQTSLGSEAQRVIVESLQRSDNSTQSQVMNGLAEILRTTPPEELPQLRQRLLESGSGNLDRVVNDWLQYQSEMIVPDPQHAPQQPTGPTVLPGNNVARPSTGNTNPPGSGAGELSTLIRQVAAMSSPIPPVRQGIEQQLTQLLAGVPDPVAVAVLRDMTADIVGQQPDPDPATTSRTSFEQRLIRQLSAARVPVTSLSQQLQERLRAAQLPGGNPL